MSGQIFISYRRDDASHPAGRLYDHLAQKYPRSRIFMDIDNLDPGEDFAEAIEKSVGSCDILIAVIGRHWLDASDPDGNRRLDNPDDFVRLEISTALKRSIRVMPVLVDGAVMPRSPQLPEDLQAIVRRQAVELSHNRFATDSERIIQAINRAFEKAAAEEAERERVRLDAERRQRDEKERLQAEVRQPDAKQLLEAEQREKERLEAEEREKERLGAEQREKERLLNEHREKDRLEAERSEVERQTRLADSVQARKERELEPAQFETTSAIQDDHGETPKLFVRFRLLVARFRVQLTVCATILIVCGMWFGGSILYYGYGGREASQPMPVAAVPPTPIATATPALMPTPTATISPPSSDPAFYENRGWDFYQRRDYDKAINDYTEAIRLDPNDAKAYHNRGRAYHYTKHYDKALSDYTEAIRLDPNDGANYYDRGLAYYDNKDYDKAISDFTEAIRLDPNYAKAYHNRGLSYSRLGKNAQAQADFDKAKQLGYTGPESTATPGTIPSWPAPTPTAIPTATPKMSDDQIREANDKIFQRLIPDQPWATPISPTKDEQIRRENQEALRRLGQ